MFVADAHGEPVAAATMDGAAPDTRLIAQRKAPTAARSDATSRREVAEKERADRSSERASPRSSPLPRGVAVFEEGRPVGAAGVSGLPRRDRRAARTRGDRAHGRDGALLAEREKRRRLRATAACGRRSPPPATAGECSDHAIAIRQCALERAIGPASMEQPTRRRRRGGRGPSSSPSRGQAARELADRSLAPMLAALR